jgi:hypothetical protein
MVIRKELAKIVIVSSAREIGVVGLHNAWNASRKMT